MASRRPVVRKCNQIPKAGLHALLMEGWSRCIAKFGKGSFADALEITAVGLDKQLTGAMPDFATIMDAFDHDETVLSDILAEKGYRIVSKEAVCDIDDLSLLIARVLVLIKEAEHPDSPGGRAIVHSEFLAGEDLMRQLHVASGEWLETCSRIRRPRAVA